MNAPATRLRPHDWLFWLVVGAVALAVRGPTPDEALQRAQVLAGDVPYPGSHPLYIYAHNAFGVHYHAAAALLQATGALSVLLFRNALHLAATVLPALWLGAWLGGRAWAGHAAAALTLAGVHTGLSGYYPLSTWPEMFSSGHLGLGYALAVLALVLAQRRRSAYLLAGLMPVVHVGLWPLVLAFLASEGPSRGREGIRAALRAVPAFAAGLVLTAGWALLQSRWQVPVPQTASEAEVWAAWRTYTFNSDVHRAYLRFGSPMGIGLAFAGAALLLLRYAHTPGTRGIRPLAAWLAAAGMLFAVGVGGQALLGSNTPWALITWMPHRLSNAAAVLCPLLVVGVLARRARGAPEAQTLVAVALTWAALLPWASQLPALPARYLAVPEAPLFLLAGAALAWPRGPAAPITPWAIAALAGCLALAHQWGALLLLAGAAAAQTAGHHGWTVPRPRAARVCAAAFAVLLASALAHEAGAGWRVWNDADPALDWLREQAPRDALLAAPHDQVDLQARTGVPILATYETHQFIPYLPALAPATLQLYAAVYGEAPGSRFSYALTAWRDRSTAAWQRLAETYGFTMVLAPARVPLKLPAVPGAESEAWRVYRVPPR